MKNKLVLVKRYFRSTDMTKAMALVICFMAEMILRIISPLYKWITLVEVYIVGNSIKRAMSSQVPLDFLSTGGCFNLNLLLKELKYLNCSICYTKKITIVNTISYIDNWHCHEKNMTLIASAQTISRRTREIMSQINSSWSISQLLSKGFFCWKKSNVLSARVSLELLPLWRKLKPLYKVTASQTWSCHHLKRETRGT